MGKYITYKDRVLMEGLLKDGVSIGEICKILEKSRNAVSLEFQRSNMNGKNYNAYIAQMYV